MVIPTLAYKIRRQAEPSNRIETILVDIEQDKCFYSGWGGARKKNWPKNTTFMGLWGSAIKLESQNFQKAHIGPLSNLYTKFQLLSSIWSGDRGKTSLIRGQKGRNPLCPPPLPINLEHWFLDILYSFELSVDWLKKEQFLQLWPLSTPLLWNNRILLFENTKF